MENYSWFIIKQEVERIKWNYERFKKNKRKYCFKPLLIKLWNSVPKDAVDAKVWIGLKAVREIHGKKDHPYLLNTQIRIKPLTNEVSKP